MTAIASAPEARADRACDPSAIRRHSQPDACASSVEQRTDGGQGRRLLAAIYAFDALPALACACERLIVALARDGCNTGELVCAIESDIALSLAVMRLANRGQRKRMRVDSVAAAVAALDRCEIERIARGADTFELFEHAGAWGAAPERFGVHALATQRVADHVAAAIDYEPRERLRLTSLLHDVGKLVLAKADPLCMASIQRHAATPAQRVQLERTELGVDHAVVGAVLLRRWGLPSTVADAVEHHHQDDAGTEAAIIRLADLLAHHASGAAVASSELLSAAHTIGLGVDELQRIVYEQLAAGTRQQRQVPTEDCPLSTRELSMLRRLAEGKVYKQIAQDLDLSTSTVRSHLHSTYGKLGVSDRAQAVLLATQSGWL
ncbi:MAG TPA: HDOD domain-containing protein [Solirubrobacteraceae bacterium]|jgi:putative nucleotidyltransferase with HDIG domain|nr:HDOD domain-containing protein [Solirubrobacteraceae bacterium]